MFKNIQEINMIQMLTKIVSRCSILRSQVFSSSGSQLDYVNKQISEIKLKILNIHIIRNRNKDYAHNAKSSSMYLTRRKSSTLEHKTMKLENIPFDSIKTT